MASLVSTENTKSCVICRGTDNLRRCARCKVEFYCSREHQVQHWPTHKIVCGKDLQAGKLSDNKGKNDGAEVGAGDFSVSTVTDQLSTVSVKAVEAKGDSAFSTPECKESNDKDKSDKTQSSFDSRPLNVQAFPQPRRGMPMEILPQHIAKHLNTDGYCVLDNILKNRDCDAMIMEAKTLNNSDAMKSGLLAGGRTSAVDKEKIHNSEIRSDRMCWVNGTEQDKLPALCNYITEILDPIALSLTPFLDGNHVIINRTKAMVACYPGSGTAYKRHVDNPSGDGRCITCILYLNKDWDVEKDGGVLRIFPQGKDDYVDVVPVMNRLLVFWSDSRNPHEVQPAFKHRYAVTVWYYDQEEREKAKEEERVSQELIRVKEDILRLEAEKKEIQRKTIQQEIENLSMQAIRDLSEGELQAIAEVIKDHPNPKEVLTGLGINPTIQDYLIKEVKTRFGQS